MAGYSGISMSNNAVDAYDRGLCPASKIHKTLPQELIVMFCKAEEWHHSSPRYNAIDFYNPDRVKATFGIIKHESYPPNEKAIAAWVTYKEDRKAAALKQKQAESQTFSPCLVNWSNTDYKGKRRYYEQRGCTVVVKGNWCFITFPDGKTMNKAKTTKYFSFEPEANQDSTNA